MTDSIRELLAASDDLAALHSDAVSWLGSVNLPVSLVWMRRTHVAPRNQRPESLRSERIAYCAAIQRLFPDARWSLDEVRLGYTHLGAPKVILREEAAKDSGIDTDGIHISFSHDGDIHLALAAYDPQLRGIGVDILHLPRLQYKDESYLRRFAAKFMSDEELEVFELEGPDSLAIQAAAHFSLMESASKALGTGLKIGGGMGRPGSLPKQSINVLELNPVRFSLGPEAGARSGALNASRLEGYWGADSEYLVSAAFISSSQSSGW